MPFHASMQPGRFSLLLKEGTWLEPAVYGPKLAKLLGLPKADVVRLCRLQRGLVFDGAALEVAKAVQVELQADGIESVVVPDAELPLLPEAVDVSVASLSEEGLGTPSLQGIGMPKLWPWEHLTLVAAGILVDPDVQAAGVMGRAGLESMPDAEDRKALADGAVRKARQRVFPLQDELAADDPLVTESLSKALSGEGVGPRVVPGFGVISTVIDLMFAKPFDRLRIQSSSRIVDLERTYNLARLLHASVCRIIPRASNATVSGAALALQHGADSGEYVFDDLNQFDDYCRWTFYWRLQRQSEQQQAASDQSPETEAEHETGDTP